MRPDQTDPLSTRLDVLIRLLLDKQRKEDKHITLGDQIVLLESFGLRAKDAAKILGIDASQLSSYRRTARKKPKS